MSTIDRLRSLTICKQNAESMVEWYSKAMELEESLNSQFPGALDILWEKFQESYKGEDNVVDAFYDVQHFQVVENNLYVESTYTTLQWHQEKEFWFDTGEEDEEPVNYFKEKRNG